MLKTLDVLIGTITVVLLFSMAVTVITQAIISAINTRGKHLKAGLADLLQQLGIDQREASNKVAEAVLHHPLLASGRRRKATVVHRDELTKVLLDLAAGSGAKGLEDAAKAKLVSMLQKNGVQNPATMLSNIHTAALQLEQQHPELTNDVRAGLAVVNGAASQYVARLHAWFDQTMDRVSERFTFTTRQITFVVAIVVAFAVQLDIIAVFNRLSLDDKAREALIAQVQKDFERDLKAQDASNRAQAADKKDSAQKAGNQQSSQPAMARIPHSANTDSAQQPAQKTPQPSIGGTTQSNNSAMPGAASPTTSDTTYPLKPEAYYKLLGEAGLITPVWDTAGWRGNFGAQRIPGIFLSVLLLSMGAPFWYGVLKNLLQLRSTLAQKDDIQRANRQVRTKRE